MPDLWQDCGPQLASPVRQSAKTEGDKSMPQVSEIFPTAFAMRNTEIWNLQIRRSRSLKSATISFFTRSIFSDFDAKAPLRRCFMMVL